MLKQAHAKDGSRKHVTLNDRYHCYAARCIEKVDGSGLIQEMHGHTASRSIEIKTHVTETRIQEIQSLFDEL